MVEDTRQRGFAVTVERAVSGADHVVGQARLEGAGSFGIDHLDGPAGGLACVQAVFQ